MTLGSFPAENVRASWEAFPDQHARTQRFTLGVPRHFVVSPDGGRVVFLQSTGGSDPVGRLLVHDVARGTTSVVADPAKLAADEQLTAEELARRERVRESAGGITSFATDSAAQIAAFTLGGQVFIADLLHGGAHVVFSQGGAFDPRPDPTGQHIAFTCEDGLWVVPASGGAACCLVREADTATVTWGTAEFIAAEEMNRYRGYWWAPDGSTLLAARVDEAEVQTWYVHNPADPGSAPTELRYPAAGTPNAAVQLSFVGLDGARRDITWDAQAYPYLADVHWAGEAPLITVQSRDQRKVAFLEVGPGTGATTLKREVTDDHWVELVPGLPVSLADGRLLHWIEDGNADRRRLAIDGSPISEPSLQLRGLLATEAAAALVSASAEDPTAVHLWRVPFDGGSAEQLTHAAGVHSGAGAGGVLVVQSRTLEDMNVVTEVRHPGGVSTLPADAETPVIDVHPEWVSLGSAGLNSALLLPDGWTPDDGPLPVLLDPYGGPHAQRVLRVKTMFTSSQWFADAGFAVLVTDGRGSPGRGHAWERAVSGDLASPPLDDQVAALHAAAEEFEDTLDVERVGIRGWSFGGFLAALAVMRRPDVFHAAVAGAPVTEWRLYDTHYTERYLGNPNTESDVYDASSLLPHASQLARPLLLIHGLADDNVVAAHTLQLSRALLEAGRPHRVLPLVGVTHMTPQAKVAAALLHLQLDFLSEALRTSPRL